MKTTRLFDLSGKTAMVTGAATGIGQAVAIALARQGAKVAVSDLPGHSLDDTCARVAEAGGTAYPLALDVRDAAQRAAGVAEVRQALGDIDILVNNAGINRPSDGLSASEENWDNTYDTNVKGGFFLTQLAAPGMISKGWGRVIFISSQSGLIAIPGQPIYCSSKGALVQLARTLGVEWAKHGITVNTIAPTFIRTNLTSKRLEDPEFLQFVLRKIPCGQLAEVEDVANAAVYLASREAKMVNCHTLCVDGGWSVW